MKSKSPGRVVLIPALLMVTLVVNGFGSSSIDSIAEEVSRPEGWTEETHGKSSDPNYAIVFPQDRVNRINIIIEPSDWQIMLDDMTELYGEFGTAENTRGGFAGNMMPPPRNGPPPAGQNMPFPHPPAQGMPPAGIVIDDNPIWVEATIEFENITWNHVGIRFKGNSSLNDTWGRGNLKLPIKLDFDQFEDDYPQTDDQRFFGFKQLTLSSNFMDNSLLREKVTADGSFTEEAFDKETNQDEADWSDILFLFDILHSEERLTDPAAWRENLESIFDVDIFLMWLAVNTVVQNWDAYGLTFHNYYLYNNPTTGLLTWIPWDNNMALRDDIGHFPVLSPELTEVDDNWPLIRYLMDDEEYQTQYVENVAIVMNGPFEPEKMTETYRQLHELIMPYVIGDEGEIDSHTLLNSAGDFERALDELIEHVNRRHGELM